MNDLAKLAFDLAAAGAKARRLADVAVRKTGLDVVRIAQMQAPVDTGNLRASIGMTQTGPTSVEVGPTAHYGAYVEYGTYKMAAQPYMSPAADAAIPGLIEALSTLGIDAIGG